MDIKSYKGSTQPKKILTKIKKTKTKNRGLVKELTPFLNAALVGIILGDGHLGKNSIHGNARLNIIFAEKYQAFALYKTEIFSSYISSKGLRFSKVKSSPNSRLYGRYSLTTLTKPVFTAYHDIFYKSVPKDPKQLSKATSERTKAIATRYKKIIPSNIEDLITEVSLAFWIAGDGHWKTAKETIILSTHSFTEAEVKLLSQAILNKFGIESRIEKAKKDKQQKDQYVIVFRKTESLKLQNIVKDNMPHSMLYRIGLPTTEQI